LGCMRGASPFINEGRGLKQHRLLSQRGESGASPFINEGRGLKQCGDSHGMI